MSAPIKPFFGRIINGEMFLDRIEDYKTLVESLEGKQIKLILDERPDPYDLGHLRRYFHGVVLPHLMRASGYSNTKENVALVKAGLKERFLTVRGADGEPAEVRSTESLTASEYSEFIFHCRHFAAETYSLDIPDPN